MHKITASLLALMVLPIALTACSNKQDERPTWIDNAKATYPSAHYLSAVGQAGTRERAANRALANISKIFSVSISDQSQDLTQAISKHSSAGATTETTQKLSRDISTQTEQLLEGTIIKASWQAPQGDYYALAVLEKQPAARRLTDTIRTADRTTQDLLTYSATTAPNPILALQALKQARNEQLKREAANTQLTQVATKGIPAKTNSQAIEHLIRNGLADLKVGTQAESDSSNQTLQAALGQLGIPYAKDSNLQLKALLDTHEPSLQQGWYWLRGSYQLSFIDGENLISQKRWPIKISAKETSLLNSRLQDELNSKLPGYLIELLSSSPTP